MIGWNGEMKKKLTYKGVIGEVFTLTGAVAIIAAAVYFFSKNVTKDINVHFSILF